MCINVYQYMYQYIYDDDGNGNDDYDNGNGTLIISKEHKTSSEFTRPIVLSP
jgi:hypothetical protein